MRNMDGLQKKVMDLTAARAGIDELNLGATLESLGLDSSDAVILAMEIEELIDKEVDPAIFMRFETVGEAAQEIERIALE
jgi:acyl carrier protein